MFPKIILGTLLISVVQCSTYCPGRGYYLYTNGISCIRFVTDNRIDYDTAMNITAAGGPGKNRSSSDGKPPVAVTGSLIRSQNSTLDLKTISRYAKSFFKSTNKSSRSSPAMAAALWVGDCFNQCNDELIGVNYCPAWQDGSIVALNCSLELGYIFQASFDIWPNVSEFSYDPVYAGKFASFTLDLPSNLDDIITNPFRPISWTDSNSQELNSSQQVAVLANGSLFFSNVTEDLFGIYKAWTSNGFNRAVIYAIELQQAVFVPPTAKNISIPMGHLAVFECASLTSRPLPEVTWFNDSLNPIMSGGRYHVSQLGTLYIREVAPSDSGLYHCQFSNSIGSAMVPMQLNVIEQTVNETMLLAQFIQSPMNQTILDDEEATFECTVMTNHIITSGSGINIVTNYLFKAAESFIDSVVYLPFVGSNIFPSISYRPQNGDPVVVRCQAQITVSTIGTGSFTSESAIITPNERANISSISSSATISLGKPVSLTCSFKGTPLPSVHWYFNGYHVDHNNTDTSDSTSTLKIWNFTLADVGTYQCMAHNVHSVAVSPVILSPKDGVPGPVPFTPTLMGVDSIMVEWDPPVFTNALSRKLLRYFVEWRIKGTIDKETSVLLPYTKSKYLITQLRQGVTYEVGVVAISTTERGSLEYQEVVIPDISKPTSSIAATISSTAVSKVTSSMLNPSTASIVVPTTSIATAAISPSVGAILPGGASFPMYVVILIIVLSIAVFLLVGITGCFVGQCIWWRRRGTKGNYSPEKIEEEIEREAMMSVVAKPIPQPSPMPTPTKVTPSSATVRALLASSSSAPDNISEQSVEVIRVDSLYSSRDDLCNQPQTQSKL